MRPQKRDDVSSGKDVFVHISAVEQAGLQTPREQQVVR
jgi:cold shock CspA family protein